MKKINVIFFGDSICVGQYISIHKGWVTRISAGLSDLGQAYDCQVIVTNASTNGRTTRQALEQMPYEVQSQTPDILIVQFGMNDCNYWKSDGGVPRVSPQGFAANLEEIINRAFTFGVKKVFLNVNHPSGLDQKILPYTNISYEESNQQYNQIIREVAAKQSDRVGLNDAEAVFRRYAANNRQRLLDLLLPAPDLLHPSEQGHALYFEAVYPPLKETILELIHGPSI